MCPDTCSARLLTKVADKGCWFICTVALKNFVRSSLSWKNNEDAQMSENMACRFAEKQEEVAVCRDI